MTIECSYNVDPDPHGVIDGRELARHLVGTAVRMLAAYVDGCPACVDTLFGVVANDVLKQLHHEAKDTGRIKPFTLVLGEEATKAKRQRLHFEGATSRTAELMGVDLHHHEGAEH